VIIISDTSALSCLAELGELDLLRQLYGTVTITATVRSEALQSGAPAALQEFVAHPRARRGPPTPKSPKGSVKRAAFAPADASAITDESRFTLPEPRLP
jgi:hypothetical protein